jgi:hypothetical protein
MPSATYELVHAAITGKKCVKANYNGYERLMSPHTLGYSKSGAEQALFYQYAGGSSKGLSPDGDPKNWRCIPLSGLTGASLIDGAWHSAPNHSIPQTCVPDVRLEVAY